MANIIAPNTTNCTIPSADDFPSDPFTMDQKRQGAIIVHILIALYAFGALSVVCNYYFISAIVAICKRCGMSEDVAGATFMSIGTSAPELVTTCIGVFITKTNVGLETVAGSTVFNMFFIVALVTICAPGAITAHYWPVFRDLAMFVIVNVVLAVACWDGIIRWYEALAVLLTYCLYILIMVFNERIGSLFNKCSTKEETSPILKSETPTKRYNKAENNEDDEDGEEWNFVYEKLKIDNESNGIGGGQLSRASSRISLHELTIHENLGFESQMDFPDSWPHRILYILFFPMNCLFFITIPDCNRPGCWQSLYLVTFVMSAAWIGATCYLMVWMVEDIGATFFIPEPVMGITFLAIGTSIPDCLASVVAAKKGYEDMAIANVLGSNIFDLTCTAVPWLLKIAISGSFATTIVIGNTSVLFTILSLLSSALILLAAFFIARWKLTLRVAVVLLFFYAVYLVFSILYELNVFGLVNLPYCS